jgi:predicted aconitase
MMGTCTPYHAGNVPVMGEHCAWMESSAVVYCNAVIGARTNTEGRESTGAASLTGRIPYWGYHCPERRFATHSISIECEVNDMMDWGVLGYFVGEVVQDGVPAIDGVRNGPDSLKLKHFGAAASSSGGIEMYHIPAVTPEAASLEAAFDGKRPVRIVRYGASERRMTYENLNSSANSRDVDFIMLGCPHNSIEQMQEIAGLLERRRIHENAALWIHASRAIKKIADQNGCTETIERAGAVIMTDTCPAVSGALPTGTRVVATDSAKHAHYLPAITGVETWFGSLSDCVDAAVTGRWKGGL